MDANTENKDKECYYWKNNEGTYLPKHELSNLHICNIVMKFGKDWLRANGHNVIVSRFESLNKKYLFFNNIGEDNA